MKPSRRFTLIAILGLTIGAPGCGPDQERRMVFTAPRRQAARVAPKAGAKAKGPTIVGKAPATATVGPSRGVDVPMFEP